MNHFQNCKQRALVFGASGAIGTAIASSFEKDAWEVIRAYRTPPPASENKYVVFNPFVNEKEHADNLLSMGKFDAVCWAQGRNATDNVYDVGIEENLALYQANCLYILASLKLLLSEQLLGPNARLCIISSIWQNIARQNKLSYCMSKAALQGLVQSASIDLAKDGILINAILPGALDTPMTRQNLLTEQVEKLTNATLFNKLPSLEDVSNLAVFLCSSKNTGITGQFIAADLGFSHARLL
jgi:NAD(P)-dependent dehydrogenase (short-subunit alcohol dehydrogenase family)